MFSIKKIRFYIVISLLTVILFSLQAAGQQQFLTQGDLPTAADCFYNVHNLS